MGVTNLPIYAFACASCRRVEDRFARMGEDGSTLTCSHCGHTGLSKDRSSYLFAAHGLPNGHIAVGEHFGSQGKKSSDSGDKSETKASDKPETKASDKPETKASDTAAD